MVWTGLLVYTICFIIYFFFVSSSSKSFYQQNLAYYEIASSLIQLSFRYRMLLGMTIEGYRIGFAKWFSKFYGLGNNPDVSHIPVFGNDYFNFTMHDYSVNIKQVYESYMVVVRKINDLDKGDQGTLNDVIWGEGVDLKDYNLVALNNTKYNYTMRPDSSIFIPILLNNMLILEAVLYKEIQLLIIGANWNRVQARPFFANELAPPYTNFVFILVNSFYSVMPKLESSQQVLFDLILKTQVENYDKDYKVFVIYICLMTVINFICMFLIVLRQNNTMNEFYKAYSLMKAHEIEIQCEVIDLKYKSFVEHMYNEAVMLSDFIYMNWSMGRKNYLMRVEAKKYPIAGGVFSKVSQAQPLISKSKRFKKDKIQTSTVYLQGVNLFYGLFILLLILLSLTFNTMSSQIISFQQFFIKTNYYITDVNKYLQTYNLFSNFGNYMKIDGQFVSNDPYKAATENMIQYFSQNKILHTNLLQEKYKEISSFLDSDLCSFITDEDPKRIPQIESICRNSQKTLAVSGLNSFLLVQKEYMNNVTANTLAMMTPADYERTKYSLLSIGFSAFLETVYTRIRYMHYLAFESFTRRLTQVVLERIEQINTDVTNLLSSIQIICTLILVLYVSISSAVGIYLIRMDFLYAVESFKSITPAILMQNPYLLNLLKTLFEFK